MTASLPNLTAGGTTLHAGLSLTITLSAIQPNDASSCAADTGEALQQAE